MARKKEASLVLAWRVKQRGFDFYWGKVGLRILVGLCATHRLAVEAADLANEKVDKLKGAEAGIQPAQQLHGHKVFAQLLALCFQRSLLFRQPALAAPQPRHVPANRVNCQSLKREKERKSERRGA